MVPPIGDIAVNSTSSFVSARWTLERFRAKWIPVRGKKTRQIKIMEPASDSVRSGMALIFLTVAALALAGCGRKGGLDLPPTASEQSRAAAAADDHDREAATKGSLSDPSYGMNSDPAAARGTKKSFILDPLLDSH
ncbi:conserved hypothetical protein [Nitrobacter hamburgensis X14]|uniref:Lipoprotein n=2 Tax=Nitrobacter hamburgensis TaxID=912 RepID=Q1QHU2_NITHX|nr:conserved hypothetical protein [Nitrobacter hamburgensis X14]